MFPSAGIILAGGRSRRMGSDKALLPLPDNGHTTFVEHLATLLTSLCQEVTVIARDADQAASYTFSGVRVVTDKTPDVGPLMGLYTGLSEVQASHALVTAVDMPFVQPEIVSFLLAQSLDDALVVPMVQNIPQVLFSVYPRSILPKIEARLREGRRDPRSLLDVVPVRYIEEAQLREIDPRLRSFVNVNTPEEYAQDR